LGGKLVKLRITIRIIRTPGRAGTPLRGAHVLNVMVRSHLAVFCFDEIAKNKGVCIYSGLLEAGRYFWDFSFGKKN
jgi:hypothetical protein